MSEALNREKRRGDNRRFLVRLHPLFFLAGIVYAFAGELLLFLISCLVALQHECAHAFAAAKRGYALRAVVLMPYGAVIDGDVEGLRQRDEIAVAAAGPLCNVCTAALFGAVWWFFPTVYAFTDTAFYTSLAIALVNLLPAYPLDGGRILRGVLMRTAWKGESPQTAARRATNVCKVCGVAVAVGLSAVFAVLAAGGKWNFSLLAMSVFVFFGVFAAEKDAVYRRIDFSYTEAFEKGALIRRVAVRESCPVKDTLPHIARGEYLVLEVYNGDGRRLFELPQNELSVWFLHAESPYDSLGDLYDKMMKTG